MIIGATFSYEGSFTTSYVESLDSLAIRTSVYGNTVVRVLKLKELPAFIEYLENNDSFMLNGVIRVEPKAKWKQLLIDDLKDAAKHLGESA